MTIILAAGGTGGHLYPAEALAQELLDRGHKVVIVTDKRGNAFKGLGDKVSIHCVRAGTTGRPGLAGKAAAAVNIAIGITQAAMLLRKYRPSLIVGFGGYPSFPTVFAAQRLGIPTILHEQNAVLGKANKYLARKAIVVAASLPLSLDKSVVTGNPVRAGIRAVRDRPYAPPTGTFEIFITGGSQAAKVFGEVVPEACWLLPDDIKSRLHVVHQCRVGETDATIEKYRSSGIKAEIRPFFNDMPERLSACHLFIGRSGASTVAEIAVVGRPAIFVPYPGHADQQQLRNAETIADKGGCWIMMQDEFTPETLAKQLELLAKNPAMLENAAKAAKSCGQPEAVKKLADVVEEKIP